MKAQDIVKGWKTVMKRHAGLKKAQLLIDLAKNSVGSKQAQEAYKLHLEHLLEEFDLAKVQLERVEKEVTSVLNQITFAKKIIDI